MQGIDEAHARFITGLVTASKPTNILEVGYGAGVSCLAICKGVKHNHNKPRFTIVDNWHDWGGVRPTDVDLVIPLFQRHFKAVDVITSDECDYVTNWWAKDTLPIGYDFIMMDGDHQHTHEWSDFLFHNMLAPGGWLLYHDVDGAYSGLKEMAHRYLRGKAFVFDINSRPDEQCNRGLLVIQK